MHTNNEFDAFNVELLEGELTKKSDAQMKTLADDVVVMLCMPITSLSYANNFETDVIDYIEHVLSKISKTTYLVPNIVSEHTIRICHSFVVCDADITEGSYIGLEVTLGFSSARVQDLIRELTPKFRADIENDMVEVREQIRELEKVLESLQAASIKLAPTVYKIPEFT